MLRQTILVFLHDMISNVLHDRVHLKINGWRLFLNLRKNKDTKKNDRQQQKMKRRQTMIHKTLYRI
jgi:hypothetical protein